MDHIRATLERLRPRQSAVPVASHLSEFGDLFGVLGTPLHAPVNRGVCLGYLEDAGGCEWWTKLSRLEGSFAVFRASESDLEVITDVVASRSIFYVHTADLFVASSSQRAIACVLGSFSLDEETLQWALQSGSTGPGLGWDPRVRLMPPDSTATLSRRDWSLTLDTRSCAFNPERRRRGARRERLLGALSESFAKLPVDPKSWVLPLSGGFDSRAAALLLPSSKRIPAVTWGAHAALRRPGSDAIVAAEVARALSLPHQYVEIDDDVTTPEEAFSEFVEQGDGRVDHMSGYLDGLNLWGRLAERGVQAILRGDEAFGWLPVVTSKDVCRSVGLPGSVVQFAGVSRSAELVRRIAFSGRGPAYHGFQPNALVLPTSLHLMPGESLATWRDRLYRGFRLPTIVSALTELKSAFVEVVNPFLTRRVLREVETWPDSARTSKVLFRETIAPLGPQIGYATRTANPSIFDWLTRPDVRAYVGGILKSSDALRLIREPIRLRAEMAGRELGMDMGEPAGRRSRRQHDVLRAEAVRMLRRFFPSALLRPIKRFINPDDVMDARTLALRICIAVNSIQMLEADAAWGAALSGLAGRK